MFFLMFVMFSVVTVFLFKINRHLENIEVWSEIIAENTTFIEEEQL